MRSKFQMEWVTMSSSSWLASPECSISQSSNAIQWLAFIFLSPCSQRLIFSAIDVLFILTLLVFSLQKLCSRFISKSNTDSSVKKPLLETTKSYPRVTIWFNLCLVLTALLAICYTVLCILAVCQGVQTTWKLIEALFRLAQAITHVSILILIAHERKLEAVSHPMSLRVYWVANFVVLCLLTASGIARFITVGGNFDTSMKVDDIVSIFVLPISAFLLFVAVKGTSGIVVGEQELGANSRSQVNGNGIALIDLNVSGYATASWFSKLTWFWLNPILKKGYKSTLKMDDVPSLSPEHRAERMAELFAMNWPKPDENSKNPVRTTLIRCFWKDIVFTGLLAVVKLIVMYVGPVLINGFVDFTSGKGDDPNEGYYLVSILLVAKIIECISSHHFNFHSQKLGMQIRCTVITALYKKGLKLSCSSRQDHGVGQIVNYMAVDAQQLSDLMLQLHSIWLMPFQLGVALALLYYYMGLSMLAALVVVVGVMIFSLYRTRKNNIFQYMVMKSRDSRLKATNEMLNNMRVIKFQAWEEHFNQRIQSFRDKEYGWLSKFTFSMSFTMILLWCMPVVLSALVFGFSILLGVSLDPGTVFTATTVLRIIQDPVRTFPQALISVSQALISLGRLDGFLVSQELDDRSVEREEGCDSRTAVEVIGGTFSWEDEGQNAVLKNVNLEIKKGELAAIVGTVGSGKSSLLASILGELHKKSGKVRVCGTTGYVAQTSWIQNATIQENILFGSPMNKEKYNEAIRVCCLEKDFEVMDHGDQTEIGERGINLSGGQKQRIQLARAVYQDCDIYLLDDIFSAVDAHTGSEIFKECVRGALKDKTVLLVTHQVDFLHKANHIYVMRDGMIVQSGRYQELLESGLDFGELVAAYETSMDLVEMSTPISTDNLQAPKSPHTPLTRGESSGESKSLDKSKSEKGTSKLIEDEERETGSVSGDVYKQYCTEAYGWWGVAAVITVSVAWQSSLMGSDYWLAYETSDQTIFKPSLFMLVYSILAATACVLVIIRAFIVAILGLKTAQQFFSQILRSVLHAPMSFFDTTPSGRILSRASTDQAAVDFMLPFFLSMTLVMYFNLITIVVITCMNAWPVVFLVIPLIWVNIWYRGFYLVTSRELTRLDAITKAPVIHHFSETVSGVMTIRCFRKQERFFQGNVDRVNANLRMDFHNNSSNEWFGFRLELIGSFFLCISTMIMVLLPSSVVNPEYVGLALSYGLSLNVMLFFTVYMSCNVENKMVSVERIKQFIRIPSEAAWRIPDCLPYPNWPICGDIEIKNLQVRYRPNTPLVIKGITLNIHGGEKVGIVGRTGSGKSTLIQVFFRLVEPSGGKIIIDGVDICKLGLHDLRSQFGIIPQDPVLFEGTVRSNIDPIGLYSDTEIWKSLERCQLKDVVAAKPEKLDASVVDGGDNWSVGQRQLLCLGRVMLKHSKILFMDEATASVDSQTDAVIQKIIREDFVSCTIISIAHRIPTVMDCDKVMVMDAGWAREYEAPSQLLERPSLFGALVQEYASRSEI
ncbi:ABC transporter C family member 14 [Camellia lanceoleosa]|uniref:ABC transporter C family member 14 n=1 Tax=Camellia lanceoleosa TaxID=1840588 RepID=A0ACC0HDU6_9ERIC|nr:ABC transporter C family member 14 [Camellia lanceoleosa]